MKSLLPFIILICLLILVFGNGLFEAIGGAATFILGTVGFIVIAILLCTSFSAFADWVCKDDDKKHTDHSS